MNKHNKIEGLASSTRGKTAEARRTEARRTTKAKRQQKQEELQSCSLWNKIHIHRKIDKNEKAEGYVLDEGTR